MIIVDTALQKREQARNPIRIGLVGAGYMGRGIAFQIEQYLPGMRVVAISNRTLSKAERAYREAGVNAFNIVENIDQLEKSIARGQYAITDNAFLLCEAEGVDAVIEATGDVEFCAQLVMKSIEHIKHFIMMNVEMDATVGPILKVYAEKAGIVLTNVDGDQPGVMMNTYRFAKSIGCRPVLAGNIKGLQDYYRTPQTQKAFAEQHNLSPKMATAFADGTKISMENAIVANATGFKVGKRGMYGPRCKHVSEAVNLFPKDQMLETGLVDYILGAEPGPGVFVLGYNNHPIRKEYMKYFKMGDGPLYVFYVPYHLPHLEVPLTAARAVLFGDSACTPIAGPVCDVIAISKKDLKAGEVIDGIGGFCTYGVLENSEVCIDENLLPMGLSEGCVLRRDVKIDQPIKYDDVILPEGRLCDKLRDQQYELFFPGK